MSENLSGKKIELQDKRETKEGKSGVSPRSHVESERTCSEVEIHAEVKKILRQRPYEVLAAGVTVAVLGPSFFNNLLFEK